MTQRILTYILIAFASVSVFSQQLKSSCSESIIYVGQPVEISYSIKTDSAAVVLFESYNDAIPVEVKTDSSILSAGDQSLEILTRFSDTVTKSKADKIWLGRYTVTAWDSGIFIVPGPKVIINDSTLYFDDLVLQCMLTDPIQGVDIYDIKEKYADIPPAPFSFTKFIRHHWWWISLLLISLIAFLFWRFRKNKKPEEKRVVLSLKDRTLLAIDSLEEAKLWEKGNLKQHFVELSFILRQYLTNRYSISMMEKTTHEIHIILKQKGLEFETIQVITRILSSSDMVKFAKSEPDVMAIFKVSNLARQVVAETSPIEFETNE